MKRAILGFIFIIFIQSTCRKEGASDSRIRINNNSNKTLVYDFAYNYPDTSLIGNFYNASRDTIISPTHIIQPYSFNQTYTRGRWEEKFVNQIPSGKLEVFLFDLNVLRSSPWDTIAKNNLIVKRYDLTLDSLIKLNWVISYP
jgi:hypothetical protein